MNSEMPPVYLNSTDFGSPRFRIVGALVGERDDKPFVEEG